MVKVLVVPHVPAEDVKLLTALYIKSRATKVEPTPEGTDGKFFTLKATFPDHLVQDKP